MRNDTKPRHLPMPWTASPSHVPARRGCVRWAGMCVAALAVVACVAREVPAAVRPAVAAVETLGYQCGDGVKDNVPSGLFQWPCKGSVEGAESIVLIDGNAAGIAGITLTVNDRMKPAETANEFTRLVDHVPPLDAAPALDEPLAGWDGSNQSWAAGGVHVDAECDATQCLVIVSSTGGATAPLPVP